MQACCSAALVGRDVPREPPREQLAVDGIKVPILTGLYAAGNIMCGVCHGPLEGCDGVDSAPSPILQEPHTRKEVTPACTLIQLIQAGAVRRLNKVALELEHDVHVVQLGLLWWLLPDHPRQSLSAPYICQYPVPGTWL
jgi:hypothetical protein